MDMNDKIYIGITYWEDGESGTCFAFKSNDLISIYKKMINIISIGMNEYTVGYVDSDIDNIIECILKSNSTPSEKYAKLSKLITVPEDIDVHESFQINSEYTKWKRV